MPTRISDATRAACAAAWDAVLTAIAGGSTIKAACADAGVNPHHMWAYRTGDAELEREWASAYDSGTDALMDEHLETTRNSDADHHRVRATLNGLQFQIEKRNPERYGQRTRVDLKQTVDFAGILQRANARLEQLRAAALTAEDAELLPAPLSVIGTRDEHNQ